jgi:hypothetical protein
VGMDDYLRICVEELGRIMQRWLQARPPAA